MLDKCPYFRLGVRRTSVCREVMRMDWFSQVKREFAKAAARMALPGVWVPAVTVYGGLNAFTGLFMYNVAKGASASTDPQARIDGLVLVSLISLLATPAVVSGMWSVSREAVLRGRAGWKDFWSGLATYYWRLVGLALLAGLAVSVIALAFIRPFVRGGFDIGRRPWDFPAPLLLVYLVGQYFATPVMPAVVIEQKRAIESIGLGVRFAFRNASILVPAAVVDLAVGRILQRVESAAAEPLTLGYYFGQERLIALGAVFVLLTLVSALVSAFFRLLYLGIYHSRVSAKEQISAGPRPADAGEARGLARPEEGGLARGERPPEETLPGQGSVSTEEVVQPGDTEPDPRRVCLA